MRNLSIQKSILIGFIFVSIAVASIPYSVMLISKANAEIDNANLLLHSDEIGYNLRLLSDSLENSARDIVSELRKIRIAIENKK